MKLATWNVNSLNVRLPRLLDWLAADTPGCRLPAGNEARGREVPRRGDRCRGLLGALHGQKTYNGVAILAKHGLGVADVEAGVDGFVDEQKRLIAATIGGIRVISAYVPNGQAIDSDKYRYKLVWCDAVAKHLHAALKHHPALAIAGDFNVAPEDRDVHDPKLWLGQVLCSEPERAAFREFLAAGLVDKVLQPPIAELLSTLHRPMTSSLAAHPSGRRCSGAAPTTRTQPCAPRWCRTTSGSG